MRQTIGRPVRKRPSLYRRFFFFYLIYVFFCTVLYFALPYKRMDKSLSPFMEDGFFDVEANLDQAAVIDDGEKSIGLRLDLINQAQKSLEIAYHSLHKGAMAHLFYGAVLEAADRGVQVRVVMDGIFHGFYGAMRDLKYILEAHPNIKFRLYEPFHFYRPWRWNNRLHDKIMIVDGRIGLISGRNIGDRYYLTDDLTEQFVLDLDVVVSTEEPENPHSVVNQISAYFSELWEHPFTQEMSFFFRSHKKENGKELRQAFSRHVEQARAEYSGLLLNAAPLLDQQSIPVERIRLIHNPITRGKKDPWVWATLVNLANEARDSIVVQSPYIIPTRGMLKYLEEESLAGKEVLLLTNSLAASPNLFGMAGYKGKRRFLADWVTEIWEYYGPGSLHGKCILFDDNLSAVGSFNMDARSSFLSTETILVVESEEFNSHLRGIMQKHTQYSQPILAAKSVPDAPWPKRLLVSVTRIFSRFVDYLL